MTDQVHKQPFAAQDQDKKMLKAEIGSSQDQNSVVTHPALTNMPLLFEMPGLLPFCSLIDWAVLQWCRHLADSSRGLQTAMDMVLSYEQRSHTALAHLLGRAWTAGDLIFHAACGAAVLGAGALHARLPVLAIWLSNHLLERFLVGACAPVLSFNQEGQVILQPSF